MPYRRHLVRCAIALALTSLPLGATLAGPALAARPRALLVGAWRGIHGRYRTIQAAVDAARPGDWILIGPGDYKTSSSKAPRGYPDFPAGVLITKPDLTIRGMNRNTVIVDGTRSGPACSSAAADQNFGPTLGGSPAGLNGLMVWKADDVTIENLTACNFLGGSGGDGGTGNEIWWNGGAGSAQIDGWGYLGDHLTTTSTWYDQTLAPVEAEATAAEYGVFSSNWDGGRWNDIYASNFNDSGFYIGACQQMCNQTLDNGWAEFNALGYSGSNSGGALVVEHSRFDQNEDGFDTNSQNGDNPPPQNGTCPGDGISPITHTHSCWVFVDNVSEDNNNPNVPAAGAAAAGPVGTGMSISGGRDDTVMDNLFIDNGAWGDIVVPYPDSGPPCTGGVTNFPGFSCLFDEWGDAIIGNRYEHDGFFGNPTNGDFDQLNLESGEPTDCYSDNTVVGGGSLSSDAAELEREHPVCNGQKANANTNAVFLDEVACDSQISLVAGQSAPCLPGDDYPRVTKIVMHPLPPARELPGLAHPCAGAPANAWCARARGRRHV